MMRPLLTCFMLLILSCAPARKAPQIIDRPIEFDQERRDLSLQYMSERYGIEKDQPVIEPKMIVIHWTAIPTLQASFDAFDPVKLPGARSDIQGAGDLNVSAHFLVDRDGSIYRLMPETLMARHVIGLNHSAIGIENVGGTKETPLTRAQLRSNVYLVKYLQEKYSIDYVLGHQEYTLFEDHPLWLEKNKAYRTKKVDPGKDFMNDLRQRLKGYDLKSLPGKN
jgi:N-acetylmuramoyl-L-alanine amidase